MMERGEPRQDEQTFFTMAEVAEQLSVTARTVRRYIEQGITGPAGTRIKLVARLIATADGQVRLSIALCHIAPGALKCLLR